MLSDFYKENETDKVYWVDHLDEEGQPYIGEHLFSFDKRKIYNLFRDYPWALTEEEREIFDKENPFWKDFFRDRRR